MKVTFLRQSYFLQTAVQSCVSNCHLALQFNHCFGTVELRYVISEACESYVASLMSKLVPSALAVGTFNSGLLETLVGTSGRATGDILITVLGELGSVRNLLNNLVVPATGLMVFSIGLVVKFYEPLAA